MRSRFLPVLAAALAVLAPAAQARDGLGVFGDWGAFRDAGVPRCYAIAMAEAVAGKRVEYQPYATIGHWPKRSLRNQIHFRLSRRMADGDRIGLVVDGRKFALVGGGGDAWAESAQDNAAIVAALRSAARMTVTARGADGAVIRDSYRLPGAATAIDAALAGCAGLR